MSELDFESEEDDVELELSDFSDDEEDELSVFLLSEFSRARLRVP